MLETVQDFPISESDDEALLFAAEDEEIVFAAEDEELTFAEEDLLQEPLEDGWKVLIVDDEIEIHKVTQLALQDFTFEGRTINFINAYSAQDAKQALKQHEDVALILLDVVMETDDAGLEMVKYIRDVLGNPLVRIVLRTGQPGQVLEDVVIVNYDIDDYKTKTELTTQKLFTTVVTALRAFRTLKNLDESRKELEQIATASARFVPREFLKFLQRDSIVDTCLGDSVQAEMTILFSDIRSFTSLSENMSPKENFDFINDYLSRVGPVIRQHNGFIDKYIGDGIMALFPDSGKDAVRAAVAMQKRIALYNQHRQNSGYVPISVGIGLHTGSLMLGTIGEEERMESTVISDAVNLASRLEGLTKLYGSAIIISEQTLANLEDPTQYHYRFLDKVQVEGKKDLVSIYEVFDGDPPSVIELKIQTRSVFERGIVLYNHKRTDKMRKGFKQIDEARQLFKEVLQVNPDDTAAMLYIKRCGKLQKYGMVLNI